jgi:RND family efflux transporter MFP subunit
MKNTIYLLLATVLFASCGGDTNKMNAKNNEDLVKLKKERAALDEKIQKLEKATGADSSKKILPVTLLEMEPQDFNAYVDVQAQVNGEHNVNATSQAPGVVKKILVKVGQHVSAGQTLATLDAAVVEQQIKALEAQWTLQKSLYEKQQALWKQNIGTEVQLMSAKAQYEATTKQKAALEAQRTMYTIKSPISGTVDAVNVKEGEACAPGAIGIHVVSFEKLKVQGTLGENYLGEVKTGDQVNLIFSDLADTLKSKLSYVAQSVDPISRAFQVEVSMNANHKLHPNMSCKMQIANYHKSNALSVPVSVIQHTAQGDMLYIADGNKAKAVNVKTGKNANGKVEILSGLNVGDKVIVEGFEDVYDGEKLSIQ